MLLSAKLNQLRFDGEPHNPSGFVLAVGVVNAGDELTKRQGLLPAIGPHGLQAYVGSRPSRYGVFTPCGVFVDSTPAPGFGLEDRQRDAGPGRGIIRARNQWRTVTFSNSGAGPPARGD